MNQHVFGFFVWIQADTLIMSNKRVLNQSSDYNLGIKLIKFILRFQRLENLIRNFYNVERRRTRLGIIRHDPWWWSNDSFSREIDLVFRFTFSHSFGLFLLYDGLTSLAVKQNVYSIFDYFMLKHGWPTTNRRGPNVLLKKDFTIEHLVGAKTKNLKTLNDEQSGFSVVTTDSVIYFHLLFG